MPNLYLIVGARGEAGQSALEAAREFDSDARIIATSSKASDVEGADRTIHNVDLNAPAQAVQTIIAGMRSELDADGAKLKALFYTPAFGPVGYPIASTPKTDAEEALAFSFRPMQELVDALQPELCFGYSAFYWLEHTRTAYGAMAFAKLALDRAALREPQRYKAIRAGTFKSQATRGIGLLLQRKVRDTDIPELQRLSEMQKESGKKFTEFFFDYAFSCEIDGFGDRFDAPHRATNREDIKRATLMILRGETDAPIVSVIGDWTWTENAEPVSPQRDAAFALTNELKI